MAYVPKTDWANRGEPGADPLMADHMNALEMALGDASGNAVEALQQVVQVSTAAQAAQAVAEQASATAEQLTASLVSRNLFTGRYTDGMVTVPGQLALMESLASFAPWNGRTAVVPIQPGKTYTVKVHDAALSNVFRLGITNAPPTFPEASAGNGDTVDTALLWDDAATEHTFKNTDEGRWLLVYVSNNGSEPRLQVEEGAVATAYVPHLAIQSANLTGRVPIGLIPAGARVGYMLTFSPSFDFDFAADVLHVPSSSHIIYGGTWWRLVATAGTPFDVPLPAPGSNDIYRIYLDTTAPQDSPDAFVFRPLVSNASDLDPDHILLGMVAAGTAKWAWINGNYTIDGAAPLPAGAVPEAALAPSVQDKLNASGETAAAPYYYDSPVPSGGYAAPTVTGQSPATLDPMLTADVTALYAALSTDSGTITSRIIGYADDGTHQPDMALPITEYHYAPHRADLDTPARTPRLLVQAGIHGYEKGAVWATYEWFKDFITGTGEQAVWLREHIDVHLVPVANPYSFDNNRRHNINDVDINTNFAEDWQDRTKPDPYNPGSLWGGPAPMSELETQVLDAWYGEFAGDAIGLLDMHNTGVRTLSTGSYGLCWWISGDESVRTLAWQMAGAVSRKWREGFPELAALDPNIVFGNVSERTDGTARNQALKAHGIRSLTMDPSWLFTSLVPAASKYSEATIRTNTDVLGTAVLGFVRSFGH